MLEGLKKIIKKEQLFSSKDKMLLAVSGGVDSMVMAYLFKAAAIDFGIAHCNFQLRGEASDGDELLVKNIAKNWNIPFHTIRFNTREEGERQKKSIELIARELRYEWFGELLKKFDYQYVATAHHLNDSLETVLYNLAKGTGIRGLHGIPVKNGYIIRPLSYASRKHILDYAHEQQISYREDASNQSTKHSRNLIRLEVIPPLKKINPSLEQTFEKTLSQLKEAELLFHWAIAAHKKVLVKEKGGLLFIQKEGLKKEAAKVTLLFEFISEYGFHTDQIDQIIVAIDHVGAQFYTRTHQLLVERQDLIIKEKEEKEDIYIRIESLPKEIILPIGQLIFEKLENLPNNLNQGENTAIVDLNKLKFPLVIRNWKDGDRFQPIGMKGRSKKLKSYLRDKKVSRLDKKKVLVLESDGEIVWLIGYRIDERFKIDKEITIDKYLLPNNRHFMMVSFSAILR